MKELEHEREINDAIGMGGLAAYDRLLKFSLEATASSPYSNAIELVVASDDRRGSNVVIRMVGCRQLFVQKGLLDSMQITGMAFKDIRHLGWEDISWELFDYEENSLGLICGQVLWELRAVDER